MDIPVGMKNPTCGDLSVMLNSVTAAQHPHHFIYRGCDVETSGNDLAHTILRGGVNQYGQTIPNYHYEDIMRLYEAYENTELANPALIIDTNHANSGKNPFEQPRIIHEVMTNCKYSRRIRGLVKGFMVESYIEDGNQKIGEGVYGKSITDACLGWQKSERLIFELADMI